MKASSYLALVLATGTSTANIIFHKTQPTCNFTAAGFTGCLRGQRCTEANTSVDPSSFLPHRPAAELLDRHTDKDNSCTAEIDFSHPTAYTAHLKHAKRPADKQHHSRYSQDGRCGSTHGNLLCDPKSTAYSGRCCSEYGWVRHMQARLGTMNDIS